MDVSRPKQPLRSCLATIPILKYLCPSLHSSIIRSASDVFRLNALKEMFMPDEFQIGPLNMLFIAVSHSPLRLNRPSSFKRPVRRLSTATCVGAVISTLGQSRSLPTGKSEWIPFYQSRGFFPCPEVPRSQQPLRRRRGVFRPLGFQGCDFLPHPPGRPNSVLCTTPEEANFPRIARSRAFERVCCWVPSPTSSNRFMWNGSIF